MRLVRFTRNVVKDAIFVFNPAEFHFRVGGTINPQAQLRIIKMRTHILVNLFFCECQCICDTHYDCFNVLMI